MEKELNWLSERIETLDEEISGFGKSFPDIVKPRKEEKQILENILDYITRKELSL